MIPDKEYIEQLMLEKLLEHISEEDDEQLQQLMEHDTRLKEVFIHLQQKLSHPAAQQYLQTLDENILWRQKQSLFLENSHQYPRKQWWYRAAALLLLLAGSSSIYLLLLRAPAPALVKAKPAAPGIILQLASGEKINLSDTGPSTLLNRGTVQLHLSDKSLQYEAGTDTATTMNRLQVPAGKDYKLTLSDSTEIWLNAKSEISFPSSFKGKMREVFVSGEAFFTVKKDINHPFVVHAGPLSVNVLGTSFNINTYDKSNTKISLASGKVALSSPHNKQMVQLSPGYEALYNGSFSIDEFNQRNTLAWMEGKYYFKNAGFKEIADVINRWFDVMVTIDNAAIEKTTITGILSKQDGLTEFLDNLSATTGIKYQLTQSTLHIR